MAATLTLFCMAIVAVSVLVGLLPLATVLTHTRLQVYLSLSAGAMLGAAGGAAIGAAAGNPALGAAAGAVGGAVIGAATDPCDLDLGNPVWRDHGGSAAYERRCGHPYRD